MEFDRVYPGNNQKIIFSGGLNCKYSPALIGDNESPDCLNVVENGYKTETRGGSRPANTQSVGSFACDGLYTRYDNSGNESMVAFFGGDGYVLSGTTFQTIPSAQSVFTAGVRICAAEAEGYLFLNNGQTAYKYNGDFTRHGVPVPTEIPTLSSQAAGVLTGDYRYKISYVNSNLVEGDVGTETTTIAVAGATIRLSSLPIAPQSFGIYARTIYRTATSSSTWNKVTMLTNNTATTYDDNKADASLGVLAPIDNGQPPKYDAIAFHPGVGRLFCTNTDNRRYIHYSEANEPFTFKSTNFIPIGDFGGDLARGFGVMENSIIVYADRRPYIIYFPDNNPVNWIVIPCRSKYGCSSPFGIVEHQNGIISPALSAKMMVGFQYLMGDVLKPDITNLNISAIGSDLISDKIEPHIFEFNNDYLRNISSIAYKNKIYITVPRGTGQVTNNYIYVIDLSYDNLKKRYQDEVIGVSSFSWYPWYGINVSQFTIYEGKLYGGSSEADGYVYELNTTDLNDNGNPINSYYITKEFYGYNQDAENHKDFRKLFFLTDTIHNQYIGVSAKTNSDAGIFTMIPISIDDNAEYWGQIIWGANNWSAGISQKDINFDLGTLNGKRIQFKFSNLNKKDVGFKLHYMSFGYNVKGQR